MHNRSIFFVLAAMLAAPCGGWSQEAETAVRSAGQDSAAGVIEQSARNLFALPGLAADFHYTLQAYEQTLSGSGHYLQSGKGPEKLFRLELTTQLEGSKATQQTIGGRQYLWIRRDFGAQQRSLSRVDLRRVRQAIEESGPPLALDPSPTWLGIVSLPKMLSSVSHWFEFEAAREDRAGERRVLQVRGLLKEDRKEQLLGDGKGQAGEQVPDAVELTLGTDVALPLFPYRIAYLKRRGQDNRNEFVPLLTLDFHSAKVRRDIDAKEFDYLPGDQEVTDRTRQFMERLGFVVKDEK
jgi:uncharacterized protein YcgL (UPF0745 family)